MAEQTDVGPFISAPKGGGALHGIGGTFAADPHTGTGQFTVPLALPAGRNGFQPQLSLAYSTGTGNGPFGMGWALTVPAVTRKTHRGVPRYDDARDVFLLTATEDLIPAPGGGPNVSRYRPRTEALFALIDRHLDATTDHWEVQSKDGFLNIYGTPGAIGADPAAVADPRSPRHVFGWRLSRTRDLFGNEIVYEYARDRTNDADRAWDQLYLERIRYSDYADG